MKVFGTVVVSAFALGVGLLLAITTYRVMWGSIPACASGFKGLAGSLQCGDGNPSFAPYGWGGIAIAALVGTLWWRRFVRSLDA